MSKDTKRNATDSPVKHDAESPNPATVWEPGPETGLENAPVQSFPALRIVQGLTRGLGTSGHALANAKPGDLWITNTAHLYSAVTVIPAFMCSFYPEYPGGVEMQGPPVYFYRSRPSDAKWVDEKGLVLPNGHVVNQTHWYYALCLIPGGEPVPLVIPFARVMLKVSWAWLNMLREQVQSKRTKVRGYLPLWARTWRLEAMEAETDGKRYWTWKMPVMADWMQQDSALVGQAREFYRLAGLHYRQTLDMERESSSDALVADQIPF